MYLPKRAVDTTIKPGRDHWPLVHHYHSSIALLIIATYLAYPGIPCDSPQFTPSEHSLCSTWYVGFDPPDSSQKSIVSRSPSTSAVQGWNSGMNLWSQRRAQSCHYIPKISNHSKKGTIKGWKWYRPSTTAKKSSVQTQHPSCSSHAHLQWRGQRSAWRKWRPSTPGASLQSSPWNPARTGGLVQQWYPLWEKNAHQDWIATIFTPELCTFLARKKGWPSADQGTIGIRWDKDTSVGLINYGLVLSGCALLIGPNMLI